MKKKIYMVATSHLDTSWRWTFETTVSQYIKNTLVDNFSLFEKYPEYVFSFEGAYRYELMEEYYPELFKKLREYIAAGKWKVSGSSYENGDVNIPSPEALFRNILYGNSYFEEKFNKRSTDIYLPDCFGFGAQLPSVAAHAGLNGFTTQKLPWSSSIGIPFDIGVWQGINGDEIYACLDGEDYSEVPKETARNRKKILRKLTSNDIHFDLPLTHYLYGTGDIGGAPEEKGVKIVAEEIRRNREEEIELVAAATDTIFGDLDKLPEENKAKLPVFKGELLSTDHGVGCYTSRTPSKRFNRMNENLAQKTENLCVMASMLGVYDYPAKKLDRAWKRVIAHQFHDDLTGTSLPECYKRNWNDYILSLNEFSEEYRAAAAALSTAVNTSFCEGIPVVVHNALQYDRKESVDILIPKEYNFESAAVFDCNAKEIPSQYTKNSDGSINVVFIADMKGFSLAAFDIRNTKPFILDSGELLVNERSIENTKYRVVIDNNGDIISCYDKLLGKELLSEPIRMCIFDYNGASTYPAWELTYRESKAKPAEYARNAEISIVEQGAARVTLKTVRKGKGSTFEQYISLERGTSFVKVFNEIEWRSLRSMLKVSFPTTADNKEAAFDLGLGYKMRPNMNNKLYEVPAQMFADISNENGEYGVSILSDSKTGWDKPDNNTLRMTVLHTPKYHGRASQDTLDIGLDRFGFAICSHKGEGLVETTKNASCFNSPLTGFIVNKNSTGSSSYTFFRINTENAIVRCLKKAQFSDEIVVRIGEVDNKQVQNVAFMVSGTINSITELNASEEYVGEITNRKDALVFDLAPFKVRTFALNVNKLNENKAFVGKSIDLETNIDFASANGEQSFNPLPDGTLVPYELLPEKITSGGIEFNLSRRASICKGQTVELPENTRCVSIVAACFDSDIIEEFKLGVRTETRLIQSATERIGKWDLACENEAGNIKRDVLAWNFTHSHNSDGEDIVCRNISFFRYDFETNGETSFTLPDNPKIVVAAVTAMEKCPYAKVGKELYDVLSDRRFSFSKPAEDRKNTRMDIHGRWAGKRFAIQFKQRCFNREIKQITGKYIKE